MVFGPGFLLQMFMLLSRSLLSSARFPTDLRTEENGGRGHAHRDRQMTGRKIDGETQRQTGTERERQTERQRETRREKDPRDPWMLRLHLPRSVARGGLSLLKIISTRCLSPKRIFSGTRKGCARSLQPRQPRARWPARLARGCGQETPRAGSLALSLL